MRILFVGLNDHNGWMYEYSKLINKYTNVISNCILYKDIPGYGADIILKSNKKQINDILCIEDRLDLVCSFAKDTDIFIFNGCDIQTNGFKYGRIDWDKHIKGKQVYLFVGDMIYDSSQLFCTRSDLKTITNQPRTYLEFCDSRPLTLDLVQPLLEIDPIYGPSKILEKVNSFLYRDEGEIKDIKNFETFLMIFSFLFNEFENVEYVSTKGNMYQEVLPCLENFNYSFDCLCPYGIYSRASIEAAQLGLINFVSMPSPYAELFMEMTKLEGFCFDSVITEKDLYEKAKFWITHPKERIIRQGQILQWTQKAFDSTKINNFVNLIIS